MKTKDKGITIIALIITIIVLLIISGVAVLMLLGENGIINNIKLSVKKHKEEEAKEKITLAINELSIEKQNKIELSDLNKINQEKIKFQLDENGQIEIFQEMNKKYVVAEFSGIYYKIYDDFKFVLIENGKEDIDKEENNGEDEKEEADKDEGNKDESTAPEYKQEGLILWYDGINNTENGHNNNASIWEDLSGNENHGEIKNINNSFYSQWKDIGLKLDGKDDGVFLGNKIADIFKTSNTMEFCISFEEDNRDVIIGNYSENNSINYERYSNNNSRIYFKDGKSEFIGKNNSLNSNQLYTITYVYRKESNIIDTYINGEFVERFYNETLKEYNYDYRNVWIGKDGRTGDTATNGIIYSVRIYNKVLANDEIKNNSDKDKEKYYVDNYKINHKYISDRLQIYFDGIENAKNGHSNNIDVWIDRSGNKNHALLKNFSFTSSSGWQDKGLRFDGNNDGVYLDNMIKDLFKKDFTIEMYLKCDEKGRDILIGNYSNSNSVNFEQNSTGGFRTYWNNEKIDNVMSGFFTTNNIHITITLDKANQKLNVYKNGVLFGTINNSELKNYNYDYKNVYIGRDSRTGTTSFKGIIYTTRIYQKRLTQNEILNNYNEDVNRFK